ncbi:MAG TPA: SRPBCC family protein, partial [Candidatus Krumholzibacteria bacterium]|nr:SRPBCC family protein [Candidatus Krumholzibacteria bacterium]
MTRHDEDRIERKILLRAPRSRVWRALTDWKEFSHWFGVDMEGPFTPGARVAGAIRHPAYAHLRFDIVIDRVEPERLFAWRWIPGAMEPGKDYSREPSTLVTCTLEET